MNLITSLGHTITIPETPGVVAHFADPASKAGMVLEQTNERPYPFIVGEGLTGFDIGANAGLFALHIQDRCERLFCIEPTPEHFMVLAEMTAAYPNITLINGALGAHDGETELHTYPDNTTMNSTVYAYGRENEEAKVYRVMCRTIESYVRDLRLSAVDFVKVDIEAAEMTALTLKTVAPVKNIVKGWYVECHQQDPILDKENVDRVFFAQIHEVRTELAYVFRTLGYGVEMIRHDAIWATKEIT